MTKKACIIYCPFLFSGTICTKHLVKMFWFVPVFQQIPSFCVLLCLMSTIKSASASILPNDIEVVDQGFILIKPPITGWLHCFHLNLLSLDQDVKVKTEVASISLVNHTSSVKKMGVTIYTKNFCLKLFNKQSYMLSLCEISSTEWFSGLKTYLSLLGRFIMKVNKNCIFYLKKIIIIFDEPEWNSP